MKKDKKAKRLLKRKELVKKGLRKPSQQGCSQPPKKETPLQHFKRKKQEKEIDMSKISSLEDLDAEMRRIKNIRERDRFIF